MTGNRLPRRFVWTKMQSDARENIAGIRNRKELERRSGNGIFWWGIGESKANKIRLLVEELARPQVVFSLMRSAPVSTDGDILLWQHYESAGGDSRLPAHVIVTSSATTRSGSPKSKYFALVCEGHSPLNRDDGGELDAAILRNIGGKGVGSSQVTAVVEQAPSQAIRWPYPVSAGSILTAPYFARLKAPRTLSNRELRLLHEVGIDGKTCQDWLAVATQLSK